MVGRGCDRDEVFKYLPALAGLEPYIFHPKLDPFKAQCKLLLSGCNMSDISVLLIGATGVLGKPLLQELTRQKQQFRRIAILTTPERAAKFKNSEVEIVQGSLYDAKSYQG